MNAIKRQLGLMVSGALVVAGVWACTATRNSDRSWSFSFAPDMTIRAWGLEDALDDMADLLADCVAGTFPRPCTDGEMDDITKTIGRLLDSKDRLDKPVAGQSPGGFIG
ncbi:MAG: hypothetical protein HOP15_08055 [Planctomycetes bacterium]|nr:hypothetical protein [Planctomycetota bacterium]